MSLVILEERPPAPDELEKVVSFDQPSEGTSSIERFYTDDQVLRKHIAVHEIWEHDQEVSFFGEAVGEDASVWESPAEDVR